MFSGGTVYHDNNSDVNTEYDVMACIVCAGLWIIKQLIVFEIESITIDKISSHSTLINEHLYLPKLMAYWY